jgi:tyrosine-protein kinase Etk/Wzc
LGNPEQSASVPADAAADQQLALVRSRVLELELQKTELLTRYAPTSTVIRDIDRQIAEVGRLLKGTGKGGSVSAMTPAHEDLGVELVAVRAQKAALEGRAEALRRQTTGYRAMLSRFDSVDTERQRLENEVLTAKEAYLTYLRKEETARFTSALDESRILNLAIAEPASVPTTPEQRPAMLAVFMGFLLSLGAGIALAFLIDWIDPTVRSATQAAKVTGIPVIGEIPS